QGLVPLLAEQPSGLQGLVAVVDGKSVIVGSADLTSVEMPAGQLLVVRGQADLVAVCRQQFAARREPARAVGGMAPSPQIARLGEGHVGPGGATPGLALEDNPLLPLARADDVLAAVAQELAGRRAANSHDEEEDIPPSAGATPARAAAELFARLR